MLKVVLDTNIFISGILTEGGIPSQIITAWRRTQLFELCMSEEIINELERVLVRLKISSEIIQDWNAIIRKHALLVKPERRVNIITEDPSDNKFLECALEAHTDYIVSGDKHLLKQKKIESTKVITARTFLDLLYASSKSR